MRIGLIGTGRIGAFHAMTLAGLPAVDRVVVYDADLGSARAAAERIGGEAAGDLDGLLGANLDGVVITTPTSTHAELILAARRAGLPAFCEKPVAGSLEETDAVLAALADIEREQGARGAGGTGGSEVPLQIGFQRRFDAGYRTLREAVASGRLGWTHTLRACTSDPTPPHAGYIPGSGGIFRDCAVHDYDIIRWVTGREVTEVYATGSNRGDDFFAAAGDVDTGFTLLTLDDGTLAVCTATRYNGAGYDVRLEVCGSKGTLVAGLTDETPLTSAEGAPWPSGTPHPGFMERFLDAYRAELTAFTEVVAGTRTSPCTVADAIEASWIAEAATLSVAEGRPVRLEEVRKAASA
jgi:myo-inositol 2-dehydrogenase/D-chiro-inositol 1-dehydrogenase